MQNPKIIGLIVATVATIGSARSALATTYVFATFKGDDAAGMKLSTYTSTDSLNFTLVSDTGFGGNTGYLRDPSIMKYSDGKYYVVYTDPMTASCCNPEDHFGIAVSSDLIHWTDLTTVKAGVPAVSRTWAPEWYIEGGIVSVIANIDTGDKLPNFEPYVFTAQNSALTSWSGPTALGIGPDYIDTYVAKLGNTYHAFVKSEVTRYLEHATAPSLTGPWTFVGKDDWAGWGSGMEGPAIVQLDNGTFRMYVDPQSGGTSYQTMTSSDLNKWSTRTSIPGAAGTVVRHGTIIRDMTGLGSNGYFTAIGGSASMGGAASTGGAKSTGGATSTGGAKSAGGSSSSGGTVGSAGALGTGGTRATGGINGTGGARATGGNASAGGALATMGGAKSTASGTGAAGESSGAGGLPSATGGVMSNAGSNGTGGAAPGMGGTANPGSAATLGGSLSAGGAVTGGLAAVAGATATDTSGASTTGSAQSADSAGSCGCRAAGLPSRTSALSALALLGLAILRSRRQPLARYWRFRE
jgi:hypothetical protein